MLVHTKRYVQEIRGDLPAFVAGAEFVGDRAR